MSWPEPNATALLNMIITRDDGFSPTRLLISRKKNRAFCRRFSSDFTSMTPGSAAASEVLIVGQFQIPDVLLLECDALPDQIHKRNVQRRVFKVGLGQDLQCWNKKAEIPVLHSKFRREIRNRDAPRDCIHLERYRRPLTFCYYVIRYNVKRNNYAGSHNLNTREPCRRR